MFKDIFGNSPEAIILDFLADHLNYDYTISDISKNTGIGSSTVHKIIRTFLEKKLVIKTRKSNVLTFYRLNLDNELVQAMLRFDFESLDERVNNMPYGWGRGYRWWYRATGLPCWMRFGTNPYMEEIDKLKKKIDELEQLIKKKK